MNDIVPDDVVIGAHLDLDPVVAAITGRPRVVDVVALDQVMLATHAALLQPTYRPSPSVVPAAEARSPVWWMWFHRMATESVLPLFMLIALPVSPPLKRKPLMSRYDELTISTLFWS